MAKQWASDSSIFYRQIEDFQKSATDALPVNNYPRRQDIACSSCRLETLCLPSGLLPAEIDRLNAIIKRGRPLRAREHLYRQNAPFKAVFAIHSGSVKTYHLSDDGREQIAGFYFPGEIVGTDGIHGNRHHNSAQALETSSICEVPYEHLEKLSSSVPHLQRRFLEMLSQQIVSEQKLTALLNYNDAEQRLIAFLLNISSRHAERQLSRTRVRLPMSRGDLGNYLGLRMETVSRVLGRLNRKGLFSVTGREVTLQDIDQLKAMVSET